jgi:ethanolaminephosphotransferase
MNEAGNHGGSDPGETEATLLFASPRFKMMSSRKEYECPTSANEGALFNFYDQVEQQDLVPTLSGLLGLPIPRNSIGTVLSELRGAWRDDESYVNLLEQNAQQLWSLVDAVLGREVPHPEEYDRYKIPRIQDTTHSYCTGSIGAVDRLACLLKIAEQQAEQSRRTQQWDEARLAYEDFLTQAQHALIDGNRPFDIFHMAFGIATCALALLSCLYSVAASWPSRRIAITLVSIAACYSITLLASTSARSEQSFWYLASAVWIVFLATRAVTRCQNEFVRSRLIRACVKTLVLHCIAMCWTSLGAAIDRELFSRHNHLQWFTVLLAYCWSSINIVQRTFGRLVTKSTAVSLAMPLATAAFVFKISCGQEHPDRIALPFPVDRISLFRAVLVLIALATLVVCVLVAKEHASADTHLAIRQLTLFERLHHLLTLFLITQSRAENVPHFLVLEHQRTALQTLLQHETPAQRNPDPTSQRGTQKRDTSTIDVAISVLLFSHTYFFCFGGSNSISSIDLSNAYNGITEYDVVKVGVLIFSANWTGAIWWCSAACDLVPRTSPLVSSRVGQQSADGTQRRTRGNEKYDEPSKAAPSMSWLTYLSTLSAFMAAGVLIVMVLCVVKREDSTVWILWGPKYLYVVFWVVEWHLIVSVGMSSVLRAVGSLG